MSLLQVCNFSLQQCHFANRGLERSARSRSVVCFKSIDGDKFPRSTLSSSQPVDWSPRMPAGGVSRTLTTVESSVLSCSQSCCRFSSRSGRLHGSCSNAPLKPRPRPEPQLQDPPLFLFSFRQSFHHDVVSQNPNSTVGQTVDSYGIIFLENKPNTLTLFRKAYLSFWSR